MKTTLLNIYYLGLKEMRSLLSDKVMVIFVIYAFTLAIYVQTQVPNAANTYTIIDTSSGNVATTMFNSTTVSGQSCTFDAQLADSGHDFQIKKH